MRLPLLLLLALLPTALLAQQSVNPSVNDLPVQVDKPKGNRVTSKKSSEQAVPLEEIRRYAAVYRAIRGAYVEPIDDSELMRASLRGLLADLDPHSAYLPAEDAKALVEDTSGAYDGIGIEVEQRADRTLRIVAAIDGTPAAKAGLRTGDVILAIDGRPLSSAADDATSRLRGKPGTSVKLTLIRPGEIEPRDLVVVRETITVTSVSSRLLEPGFGYLRISTFQDDTGVDLRRQLVALKKKSQGNLRGLVLDVRNNPGGLLSAAVETADTFLDGGIVTSTRGRNASANSIYRAAPGDDLNGAKIVMLIDAGTASAAEVLAGALRDHKRAQLLGARSFGKGSVQSVIELDNGDAIKLTTALYYTPEGRSIQAVGIVPDVKLPGTPIRGLREEDLPQHLTGEEEINDGQYADGVLIEGEAAVQAALSRLKQAAGSAPAAKPMVAKKPLPAKAG